MASTKSEPPPRESREFDIIVFGASGYAGQYLVENMARTAPIEGIRWAIAGRKKTKLQECLETATKYTGIDVKNIPIIIADVTDEKAILNMCRRTKLLLNCVGPYVFYGELVIKTCIENKTDHLDISGEPYYLERMQLKYNKQAEKSEVYALGATGIATIPIELGLQYLKKNCKGDVHSVDTILSLTTTGPGSIHYSTFESWIYTVKMNSEREKQRKVLFPKMLPKSNNLVKKRDVFYCNEVRKWCSKLGAFDCTTENTEYYNYHHRKMRPAITNMYKSFDNFAAAFGAYLVTEYVGWFLALFSWGRRILRKYHKEMSGGEISKKGPSREMIENGKFNLTFIGLCHTRKFENPEVQHMKTPDRKLVVTVDGPDPGYIVTAATMVNTALCLLKEREKFPNKGGVIPTGAALMDTTMIRRLEDSGIKFNVISDTTVF